MAGPRRRWTDAENAILRELYPHAQTRDLMALLPGRKEVNIAQHALMIGLHKSPEYLASPSACRLRRGDNVGAASRFLKGHRPWNAGLKGWKAGGRSHETRFKKGNVSKRWDSTIYCIGALRINSDGALDIKVRNGLRAWEPLRRYVWRTEVGPIPPGMSVRVKNGDPDDTRVENLRLADRLELIRENTLHNYPKPIARAIQLRGALNRRINRLEKDRVTDA